MNSRLKRVMCWLELAKAAKWSVRDMAEICQVSPRALELHFNETMGVTPKRWLTEQRMLKAAQDLQKGLSVKEVASGLEYKHAHHFSTEFRKFWGIRPTDSNSP